MRRICSALFAGLLASVTLQALPAPPQQTGPTPAERVAALKQSLADSQKAIRQYEWVETTVLSLKGEEKSRKQQRCYYGADGKVQKLPIEGAPAAQPAPPAQSSGRRGGRVAQAVVENKKDEMKDYMERAASLVQQYVPPKSEDIQRAKDANKVKVDTSTPGRARIVFSDYVLPGDQLSVDVNPATNRLMGLTVSSYIDKKDDTVTLTTTQGALADGTSYTAETVLDAKAKNIRVVVQNTGYRPLVK